MRGDERVAEAVRRYARTFHETVGDSHHVGSPLGAWLLLALTGDPDDVAAARDLLAEPHPAVAAAAAAWAADAPPAAREWLDGLPGAVERGPVPSRDQADAWARDHTLGLIEEFPLDVDPEVLVLLASALATRVTWTRPFETTGSEVFRSPWRDRVTTVLRTPGAGHRCSIARHPVIGDVAVHRASADGLSVTSVIAAPGVAPADVIAAAHERLAPVSLFDLPLGDGHAWTITETEAEVRAEVLSAVLPAWTARSEHDLTDPGFGFGAAGAFLQRLFGGGPWEAVQTATARYDRRGFEAAAVTGMMTRAGFVPPPPGDRREAELRFDRPYAVVATAHGQPFAWDGMPVFSAWVAEPADAEA